MDEMGRILSQTPCTGGFTHLRLHKPDIAVRARPGESIQWGDDCLPIMRADPKQGWIELLLRGEIPSNATMRGPIGEALVLDSNSNCWLLMGNLASLARLIFCADYLRRQKDRRIVVLLQADGELPFRPAPCCTLLPGMPAGVIATLPLLSDWGVTVRIASNEGLPGCYDGDLEQLAKLWLATQTESVTVIRC